MSEKRVIVAFRIDSDLAEVLDDVKERTRRSRSDLIRDAIMAMYLRRRK